MAAATAFKRKRLVNAEVACAADVFYPRSIIIFYCYRYLNTPILYVFLFYYHDYYRVIYRSISLARNRART